MNRYDPSRGGIGRTRWACLLFTSALAVSTCWVELQAQCPGVPGPVTQPNGATEGQVTPVGEEGLSASIAHDGARFVVAYETPAIEVNPFVFDNDVLVQRFDASGICICAAGDECPALLTQSTSEPLTPKSLHVHVSIAMQQVAAPSFHIAWIGTREPISVNFPDHLHTLTFPFDQQPFAPPKWLPPGINGRDDRNPSAAVSNATAGDNRDSHEWHCRLCDKDLQRFLLQ